MHVMIDLETMGTAPNAPIVAIGACRFDANGVSEDKFYRQVSLQSSVDGGATIEAGAVICWLKESKKARAAILEAEGEDEWPALCDFTAWLKADELSGLWGNGAAFDNAILSQTYRRYGQEAPWRFSLDRCYRTVKNFSPIEMDRSGTHHHALDDAVSQAKHLVAIWAAEQACATPGNNRGE